MFNLKDFIKKGLLSAVGKMADYQIILNTVGWFEKGVLVEEDLAEVQDAIDNQHTLVYAGSDHTLPLYYIEGIRVMEGLWYTDGENIWQCIKSGIPNSFNDSTYFNITAVE